MKAKKKVVKKEKVNRSKWVHIRLTEEELKVIEENARACSQTVSQYVREILFR